MKTKYNSKINKENKKEKMEFERTNVLKSITIDLQHFMKQSVSYLNHFSPNLLSPVSISFLSTFFHKIHNANIKWKYQSESILQNKTIWPQKNAYISLYNGIPETIRKDYIENIKRETVYQYKFTLEIGGKTFHIMLWFPTYIKRENNSTILMSDAQIQYKVYKTLQKIYMWLSIATSFIHKSVNCSKTVNIYLYLTEHMKILPSNVDLPIAYLNANTAFTTGCVDTVTNITIYREEEWFKVFMHETMHNLGLDFNEINNQQNIDSIIKQTFPISVPNIRLYESYAEIWANTMNILFVVYFTDPPANKGRLPIVRWTHIFMQRIYLEQIFSLFQATKILVFCKLKYSDLFLRDKAYLYKEETPVFCYFILKCILLLNINSLLEFCNSQKGGASLKFQSSQQNAEKYAHLITKCAKSNTMMHSMNDMYTYYMSNLHVSKKDTHKKIPFFKNTLRMTLQELL